MSSQLKAAIKSFTRNGKNPFASLHKPSRSPDAPHERVHHYVVAPPPNRYSKLGPLEDPPMAQPQISMPITEPISAPTEADYTQAKLLKFDHKMEKFLLEATETTVWEAAEEIISSVTNSTDVIYWTNISSSGVLYSPVNDLYVSNNLGLLGSACSTRSTIMTDTPTQSKSYDSNIDSRLFPKDLPTAIFPVLNFRGKAVGVISVVKSQPFRDDDEQFFAFFQHKFQIYSRWILDVPLQEPFILDILQLHQMSELIPVMTQRIQAFFNCRACEIWSFDRNKKKYSRYTETETTEPETCGIAGNALDNECVINSINAQTVEGYDPVIDGEIQESIIAIPVTEASNRFVFATVLRGSINRPLFNSDDEATLRKLAPFIALALTNAFSFSKIQFEFERSAEEREGLAALLEVAEILSGQLDTERLCEIIMEKGRYLTKADRCSLFLVSQTRDHLITSFQRGLKDCIDIPITKGIVGRTVTEAKVLNIADAYEDPNFDNATDLQTGYRTKSILSVPIFNQRGEVMGVTEMINKNDGQSFSKWDTNLIQIFNVFCGISLENARLYKESLDMTSQLRSFFGISFSLAKTEDTKKVCSEILRNARRALDSRRASIFLIDESDSVFTPFVIDGGKLPISLPLEKGIIGDCVTKKDGVICNNPYSDPRFNRTVDQKSGFKTVSLCATPIIDEKGVAIGVIELVNRIHGSFRERDLKLLKSIATFVAVTLENSKLKGIATLGNTEIEISKYILEPERSLTEIPTKLKLSDEEKNKCSSLDFSALDFDGITMVKMIFYQFTKFNILAHFKISSETFFRFVYAIRKTYNSVPYHNWVHACDVTEYVSYELKTAKADEVYTPMELFALLTSAVCHDANHDGFNNIYNLKAETPLGILFKDQSVMETHHCSIAIGVLTKEECNIFASLEQSDVKWMWNTIIKLILATDMAHHFKLVKTATELVDGNEFDFKKDDCRILSMQLLLKTADISNVSRPFTLADRWCDVLNEEFFRQGDNEKKQGIDLTSPLNDRENSDKPKSQIGFYNFICIPLYQVIAKIFPDLAVNLNSLKSNLEVWKAMIQSNNPQSK
ncbi:3'5'-cyclic nucleotide phosphodiesterase family protein [Tritrichomonas foetus]|uniref:3'5'-cyclic nucleotide phosphodiesterase family protein n=1 Tax=Tritrichomonas foetus TaxID=1144522 RepID=A0A1J4J563_9EUKA|nr:3'5'-cyclic nucleotide phosphodiesterase family protein [Tritrichomonas foetus]|eukprot:OHS93287.1 3'5'-cyclic nucleotide phosphodiesterase family protein [Tritrichomonas foetus]